MLGGVWSCHSLMNREQLAAVADGKGVCSAKPAQSQAALMRRERAANP